MENLDGFVFRRGVRKEVPKDECKKVQATRKNMNKSHGNVGTVFGFKFAKTGESRIFEKSGRHENEIKTCNEDRTQCKEDAIANPCETLTRVSCYTKDNEAEDKQLSVIAGEDTFDFCDSLMVRDVRSDIDKREMHTKLDENGTLDDLIKLCVMQAIKFKNVSYATDLMNSLKKNSIMARKRNVRRKIEEAKKQIFLMKSEEEKWTRLNTEILCLNNVEINWVEKNVEMNDTSERIKHIRKDFLEKAETLFFLKESAGSVITCVKEQCEDLIRKIFSISHKETGMDALFLLKALSKINE